MQGYIQIQIHNTKAKEGHIPSGAIFSFDTRGVEGSVFVCVMSEHNKEIRANQSCNRPCLNVKLQTLPTPPPKYHSYQPQPSPGTHTHTHTFGESLEHKLLFLLHSTCNTFDPGDKSVEARLQLLAFLFTLHHLGAIKRCRKEHNVSGLR